MNGNESGKDKKPPGADEQQTSTPPEASDRSPASEGPGDGDQHPSSQNDRRKETSPQNGKQYSTGPKTENGKRHVRRNPLKHGFYATDAVMGQADGWEDTHEFNELLDALKRDFNPQGTIEESLVHSIAVTEWRLRRVLRAEVGEIRRTAASLLSGTFFDEVELIGIADGELFPQAKSKQGARKTAASVEMQLLLLSNIRGEIERNGYISATSQQALDNSFGTQASGFAAKCYELSQLARPQQSPEEEETLDPEREKLLKLLHPEFFHPNDVEEASAEDWKRLLLNHIDIRMAELRVLHKQIETVEQQETTATLAAQNLPSREFVDKLTHYETPLERKKEKAIKLLWEFQARRSGRQK